MLTKKALSERTKLSRQSINEWIRKGILIPAATNAHGHALFTDAQAMRIQDVLRDHPRQPSYHAGVIKAEE